VTKFLAAIATNLAPLCCAAQRYSRLMFIYRRKIFNWIAFNIARISVLVAKGAEEMRSNVFASCLAGIAHSLLCIAILSVAMLHIFMPSLVMPY
jgi:hypothetical protein